MLLHGRHHCVSLSVPYLLVHWLIQLVEGSLAVKQAEVLLPDHASPLAVFASAKFRCVTTLSRLSLMPYY